MVTRIYIDECGYTGDDLFNLEQPIFCLASTSLPEETCQELKSTYFGKVRANELKHSRLATRPSQQKMIIDFLHRFEQMSNTVNFFIAHKRFVLLTKIVDFIVEPLFYDDGEDFYKDGSNISYSNLLYYSLNIIMGEKFFFNVISKFQVMIRERTRQSYYNFFRIFFEQKFPKPLDDLLDLIRVSHFRYGYNILRNIPDHSLDIAFTDTFELVSLWSRLLQGDITLVHDMSSGMAKNKAIWDRIVHPDVPVAVVGHDRRKTYFPLRVIRTDFENSKDFAGLQIVDILAGAMTRYLKWMAEDKKSEDRYAEALSTFLPQTFRCLPIWPGPEFTPEELGTIGPDAADPIEHFIELTKDLLE